MNALSLRHVGLLNNSTNAAGVGCAKSAGSDRFPISNQADQNVPR
jgi:hypothetical protein